MNAEAIITEGGDRQHIKHVVQSWLHSAAKDNRLGYSSQPNPVPVCRDQLKNCM